MLGANLIWTSLELCKWLLPFGCRRRGRRSSHCCDGNWVPLQSVDRSSTFKIYRTANVAISNLNYYWQALERCITKYLCSFHARFTQMCMCIENIGKRWTKVQWLIFPLITLTQYIGGNTSVHGLYSLHCRWSGLCRTWENLSLSLKAWGEGKSARLVPFYHQSGKSL